MTSIDRKYIREYEWGLLVDIRRLDKEIHRRFPFRQHRNAQETWVAARQWRDQTHLELFDMPVTEGFRHVAKRNGSLDTSLPAGISIGYVPRTPTKEDPTTTVATYYVVSYMIHDSTTNKRKPARKRFNFRKLGKVEALEKAITFRNKLLSQDQ